jgi:hypothetical protein
MRNAQIGKPPRKALRHRPGRQAQRLDEQDFQQPRQHHIPRRQLSTRLLAHQRDQLRQSSGATNVHKLRQQRHQQIRVGRRETAIPDQHAHIDGPALRSNPEFAIAERDMGRVVAFGGRFAAGHSQMARGRKQNEIARLDADHFLSVNGELATAFEDHAVEGLLVVRWRDTPRTGAHDRLGEQRTRLQQQDDFGQWVDQYRTLANE